MPPPASYAPRIFTTGEVGVAGSPHVASKDFAPVIAQALGMGGFEEEPAEAKFVTTGFGHEAVMGAAGAVVEAVKVRGVGGGGVRQASAKLRLQASLVPSADECRQAAPAASARPR